MNAKCELWHKVFTKVFLLPSRSVFSEITTRVGAFRTRLSYIPKSYIICCAYTMKCEERKRETDCRTREHDVFLVKYSYSLRFAAAPYVSFYRGTIVAI